MINSRNVLSLDAILCPSKLEAQSAEMVLLRNSKIGFLSNYVIMYIATPMATSDIHSNTGER